MTAVYFDSSAFLKLVVAEPGSDIAARLWDECDIATSSRLAYPEVRAAIASAQRSHALTKATERRSVERWEALWDFVRPIELTADVGRRAGELAGAHRLRGADAVHLASALAVADAEPIVAVWDARLHRGALAVGLAVAPARL